jgi:hypothetical protein
VQLLLVPIAVNGFWEWGQGRTVEMVFAVEPAKELQGSERQLLVGPISESVLMMGFEGLMVTLTTETGCSSAQLSHSCHLELRKGEK